MYRECCCVFIVVFSFRGGPAFVRGRLCVLEYRHDEAQKILKLRCRGDPVLDA